MKHASLIALLLPVSFALGETLPAPTTVGPHRLGETFQEWLTINQLDLGEICLPHTRFQSKDIDFKRVCKWLSGIRDTGSGQFASGDPQKLGPFFLADLAVRWFVLTGTARTAAFRWIFAGGKVAAAVTEYTNDTTQQMNFLEQAYGKPTVSEQVPFQNGYGAKFECLFAIWQMPDGASIQATESLDSSQYGYFRRFRVTFSSKEKIAADQAEQEQKQGTNPYAAARSSIPVR